MLKIIKLSINLTSELGSWNKQWQQQQPSADKLFIWQTNDIQFYKTIYIHAVVNLSTFCRIIFYKKKIFFTHFIKTMQGQFKAMTGLADQNAEQSVLEYPSHMRFLNILLIFCSGLCQGAS